MCVCGQRKKKKISVKESLGKAIIMTTIYLNKVLCMSAGEKCTGLKINAFLEGRVPKAVVEPRWYLSGDINKEGGIPASEFHTSNPNCSNPHQLYGLGKVFILTEPQFPHLERRGQYKLDLPGAACGMTFYIGSLSSPFHPRSTADTHVYDLI